MHHSDHQHQDVPRLHTNRRHNMSQQQQWFLGGKGSSFGAPAGTGHGLTSRHPAGPQNGGLPIRSLGYSCPGVVNALVPSFKPFSQNRPECQSQSQATSARKQQQHLVQPMSQSQPQPVGAAGPSYPSFSQSQALSQGHLSASPSISANRPSMTPKGISWSQQDLVLGHNGPRPGSAPSLQQGSKQPGASSYLQNSCFLR